MNETQTKRVGRPRIVAATRDVDTKKFLAFRCSVTPSSLDAELYLQEMLRSFAKKSPFPVDHGSCCPEAFRSLGLASGREA